jgi:hypothetical protein
LSVDSGCAKLVFGAGLTSNIAVHKGGAMLATSGVQDAVDTMLAQSRTFGEIEDFIDEQPISEDEKSALWLWAWAEQPRFLRRQIIPASRVASNPR